MVSGCSTKEDVTSLSQLAGKTFAVPTGTVADKLVLSKFPQAKFQYFNSVFDAALAVKAGKADAAAYDEPILKNIAAKNEGLTVLPDMITVDNYGFAVQQDRRELKTAIDNVIADLKKNGTYRAMQERWLPKTGNPAAMPEIPAEWRRRSAETRHSRLNRAVFLYGWLTKHCRLRHRTSQLCCPEARQKA